MPTAWLRHYMENRLFEWCMTIALLGNGLVLFIWPNAVEDGLFRYMLLVFAPVQLTFFYLVFGVLRSIALVFNGRMAIWGPRYRMMSSVGGTMLWSQMALSLYNSMPELGSPSLSIPTYGALVLGELYSAYRAARDHGHR
jgi:hypothetical protein